MRPRSSRSVAATVLELFFELLGELLALPDLLEDALLRALDVLEELPLELLNVFDRHGIEVPPCTQEDRDDLFFDRHRTVLRLLEQLDQPLAAIQLILRRLVEVRRECGERLELAVLRKIQSQ